MRLCVVCVCVIAYRARLMATFRRFLFLIKPSPYFPSWETFFLSDLTVDMMIAFLSCPWNSSTLPIFGILSGNHSSATCRMDFTCSAYGVITPISSSFRPHSYNSFMIAVTCRNEKSTKKIYCKCSNRNLLFSYLKNFGQIMPWSGVVWSSVITFYAPKINAIFGRVFKFKNWIVSWLKCGKKSLFITVFVRNICNQLRIVG